ncbi:unnamed protein product, partial [Protopolystoma xenopodis]
MASLMIKQGSTGLFAVPSSLAQDMDKNLAILESRHRPAAAFISPSLRGSTAAAGADDDEDSSQLTRTLSSDSGLSSQYGARSSCDSRSSSNGDIASHAGGLHLTPTDGPGANDLTSSTVHSNTSLDTEYAVAELCATVQALPESDPRRRRLIQRFNASNGGLPLMQAHTLSGLKTTVQSVVPNVNANANTSSPQSANINFVRGCNSRKPAELSTMNTTASKTIRSSLRRRLAIRNNIAHCFRSPTTKKTGGIKIDLAQALNTPIPSQAYCFNSSEPFFDDDRYIDFTPIPAEDALRECEFDEVATSLMSISSPTAATTGSSSSPSCSFSGSHSSTSEVALLCCPLVEALTSPFRRLVADRQQLLGHNKTTFHTSGKQIARPRRKTGSEAKTKRLRDSSDFDTPHKTVQSHLDPVTPTSANVCHRPVSPESQAKKSRFDSAVELLEEKENTCLIASQCHLDSTGLNESSDSLVLERSQILDGVYYPVCIQSPYFPHQSGRINSFARREDAGRAKHVILPMSSGLHKHNPKHESAL